MRKNEGLSGTRPASQTPSFLPPFFTDTKPFIQDLYNETAGVKRKAPPRSASSAASNVDAPGHSPGEENQFSVVQLLACLVGSRLHVPATETLQSGCAAASCNPFQRASSVAATQQPHRTCSL